MQRVENSGHQKRNESVLDLAFVSDSLGSYKSSIAAECVLIGDAIYLFYFLSLGLDLRDG